jgi:hypothetical protein
LLKNSSLLSLKAEDGKTITAYSSEALPASVKRERRWTGLRNTKPIESAGQAGLVDGA